MPIDPGHGSLYPRAHVHAPTTSEDHDVLTEQQRAVTDCTPPDAHPTTPHPPYLTRRELRAAQERLEADASTISPDVSAVGPGTAPEVPVLDAAPVSRRALRAAAGRTVDAPDAMAPVQAPQPDDGPRPRRRSEHAVTRPAAVGRSTHGPGVAHRVARIVTVVSLVTTLGVTGFAFQRDSAEARTAAADQAAVSAAQALVEARIARSGAATTARLTAEANAYADGRHAAALEAAQAALAQTDTVVQTAAPVLDPAVLTPLQAAAAALDALVADVGGATLSAAGAETTAAESEGTTSPAAPQEVLRDAAASRASRSESAGRPPLTELSEDATAADTGIETEATDQGVPAEDGTPVPLETSAQLVQMAAQVAALTAEVRATVDAKVAEEQARALAEAAAAAVAAEMARKVEIAKNAPNGEIPTDVLCAPSFAPQELVRCDAAQALERLNVAYKAEFGSDLDIVSSYRSYGVQIATRRSRGWLAAQPGTSNHGLALAVDFGSFGGLGNFSHPSYRWMKAHAGTYGWFHPSFMERGGGGPQEPWHWEFGTP